MIFEFDPNKSAANKSKHGIDFLEAEALFASSPLVIPARTEGGEERSFVIGKIGDLHWTAIVTRRGEVIRFISVRRSRDNERSMYEESR